MTSICCISSKPAPASVTTTTAAAAAAAAAKIARMEPSWVLKGIDHGDPWVQVYVHQCDYKTFVPDINVAHFENVYVHFKEFSPVRRCPALQMILKQVGLVDHAPQVDVADVPNIRFQFPLHANKGHLEFKRYHKMMGFKKKPYEDDAEREEEEEAQDNMNIAVLYDMKYNYEQVEEGTIAGVPFIFEVTFEAARRGQKGKIQHALYYPASQKEDQEEIVVSGNTFFCPHFDPDGDDSE